MILLKVFRFFAFFAICDGVLPSTSDEVTCNHSFNTNPITSFSIQYDCYYVFSDQKLYTWSEAKEMCFSGNAHILFIETLTEHTNLKMNLDYSYGQVWLGIKKRSNGEWNWVDVEENFIPVSETRWRSYQSNKNLIVAHTENIHSSIYWSQAEKTWSYRLVCESPADHQSTPSLLPSVPVTPTTKPLTSVTTDTGSQSANIITSLRTTNVPQSRYGLYKVKYGLVHAIKLEEIRNTGRVLRCAAFCLEKLCELFTFEKRRSLCELYNLSVPLEGVISIDCQLQQICYSRIY